MHLGQRFHERGRVEEHQLFLEFLLNKIDSEKVDILLISGDVFDTANPPREAEKMYYDFLIHLHGLGFCRTIITGGNHDSALHLDAPSRLLSSLNIQVVGAIPEDREECIFEIDKKGENLLIAAIPFLRDKDVKSAIAGESYDDLEARTKAGIYKCYEELAEVCASKAKENTVQIAMGHLTLMGGKTSDHERNIHIGNLGTIHAEELPDNFDYVALGHLHHPQKVGGLEHVRYSGSPIPLSFGEIKTPKELRLLEVSDGKLEQRAIPIPLFRSLYRFKGIGDELKEQIEKIEIDKEALDPWIEVSIPKQEFTQTLYKELQDLAAEKGMELLKLEIQKEKNSDSLGMLDDESMQISELNADKVFEKRLESFTAEDKEKTLLKQCFQSVVNRYHEEEK